MNPEIPDYVTRPRPNVLECPYCHISVLDLKGHFKEHLKVELEAHREDRDLSGWQTFFAGHPLPQGSPILVGEIPEHYVPTTYTTGVAAIQWSDGKAKWAYGYDGSKETK